MFGLGASEILVILVVALVVLGPQRLPDLARQLARTLGELRRVADEVRTHIDDVADPPSRPELPRAPPPAASQETAVAAGDRPVPGGADDSTAGGPAAAEQADASSAPGGPQGDR